ncbi:hypothetical protein [Nannocystis sp. SCPEA4]|uniref:hypothetical protein n=1 Tax=Nannocystis sp. SCPEA4 TaxID=2996787 RepID=UPI002270DE0A|nr:hypothetical protein [Nannocystis sp. SCPEA4]MCY1059593.1 hypothetical protein [Nannocystis sp. SCPEA4]
MAKLVCTLEMSKERGVTITVENAEGKTVQTITMDGTTLTIQVAGEQETSTLTQTAEKVTISCKDFSVVARNSISCVAAKTASYESQEGDTTVNSGARLVQQARTAVAVSATDVAVSARSSAKVEAITSEISGTQALTLKGAVQAALSGAKVSVKADGLLGLESSGLASLKGSMTNIGGSLIKAG